MTVPRLLLLLPPELLQTGSEDRTMATERSVDRITEKDEAEAAMSNSVEQQVAMIEAETGKHQIVS
jgi:hypothetical protein